MRLPLGKMPPDVLEKYVFRVRGAKSRNVVVGPQFGVDFAAVRVGRKFLIISSDPVTGVLENAGWYAVNVSGNDVATSGTRPQFMELVILLPEGSSVETVNRTCSDAEDAAKNLGIAVVGGHTEVTPTLHRTIVVVTAFSLAEKFVTAAEAKLGDSILMTKTAGIEGTSILSGMFVDRLGELFNVVAQMAADRIYKEVPGICEVYVRLLSQIGAPIDMPQVASAAVVLEHGVAVESLRNDLENIIDDQLSHITDVTQLILSGSVRLF